MAVGDSISSLRRQLRQTEREMERQVRQMEKMHRQLEEEQEIKLQQLESDMQAALQKQEQEAANTYRALLKEYKEVLEGKVEEHVRVMQKDYQILKQKVEQSRKDWEEQTELLKKEVERQKREGKKQEEFEKEAAMTQIQELEEGMQKLQEVPCEYFKKGRVKILSETVQQVKLFLKQGFQQAAIGLALAVKSDASRLRLEVEEKMQEWEHAFLSWKRSAEGIEACMKKENDHASSWMEGINEDEFEEETSEFSTESLHHSHDWDFDLNYWSFGKWKQIQNVFLQHKKEIAAIEQEGIQAYLKGGNVLSVEDLELRNKELTQLFLELTDCIEWYHNVYRAYQDRILFGELIQEGMEEEGFSYIFDTFVLKPKDRMEQEWTEYLKSYQAEIQPQEEDYRGMYVLGFQNTEGDILTISFTPIKEENQVVHEVHYCLELRGGFGGNQYQKDLLELASKVVQNVVQNQEGTCAVREVADSKVKMEDVRESQKKVAAVITKIKKTYLLGIENE